MSKPLLCVAAVVLLCGLTLAVIFRLGSENGPSHPADPEPTDHSGERQAGPVDVSSTGHVEPGFREMAEEAGIDFRMHFLPTEQGETFRVNLYDHGCGVVVGDYDGDEDDDIYFLNQLGSNALYRNRGDGTFEDVTTASGPIALDDRICVGGTFSDYDNDGDQDLYVTSTRGGNVLFQNQGDGTFVDVTDKAGLKLIRHSQTAAFFDYDRDGHLDLFVTNTAEWTLSQLDEKYRYFPGRNSLFELADSPKELNLMYRNNGDGTFTDVTDATGLQGLGWGGDVAVFDYDEDGHLDLLVTNMFGLSQLYRNRGDRSFQDVTNQTLRRTSWGAIGSKAFDSNNDGRLELLIVDMHSDMWMDDETDPWSIEESRKYRYVLGPTVEDDPRGEENEKLTADSFRIEYPRVLFGNSMFKNVGDGQFEEISDHANMETFWPWGISPGDFDNDGDNDVFLPSGMGYPFFYWRNYLMLNNGDETFTDASRRYGIEPPRTGVYLKEKIANRLATRSSRCSATADFDGDGRLDIITNNFNDSPFYYRNNFPKRNYVGLRLIGTTSNHDAIGAVVKLRVNGAVMVRQVHAAGGYLSQSSKTLHFGLDEATRIEGMEVRWPSGDVQMLGGPAINAVHTLREPQAAAPH